MSRVSDGDESDQGDQVVRRPTGPRKQRAVMARETLRILEVGWYSGPSGKRVDVGHLVRTACDETLLFTDDDFPRLPPRDTQPQHTADAGSICEVRQCTTLQAVEWLAGQEQQQGDREAAVLNFASAKHPGGGFKRGAKAQEESLACSSALYSTLLEKPEFYASNKASRTCFYEESMIYSPKVPVFRGDDGSLLEEPHLAAFITAPAVNAGVVLRRGEGTPEQVDDAMTRRASRVLAVAIAQGHRRLVLGAWGCGVFKNDPERMAGIFRRLLVSQRLASHFSKVIFAITSPEMAETFAKRLAH